MNTNLESLREEHEKLVVKAEEDPLPEDLLPQVDAFMQKVRKAGASVRDSLERDLLRSFLRYWGSYVYKHKDVYPNAQLELFTQLTPPPKKWKVVSPAFLLVAGALVLLVGAVASLFALGYLPVRQAPTPIATVLTPISTETTTTPPSECQSFRPPLSGAADFAGEVEIMTPANCITGLPTEAGITIAGTYEGVSDEVDIWVLVYPPNVVYYPQSPNACAGEKMSQGGGNWRVPVYLGGKGGNPEWFDIIVVLVDQETSQFLSNWVQQECERGQYSGITATQLEHMKITEKGYITVQTLD